MLAVQLDGPPSHLVAVRLPDAIQQSADTTADGSSSVGVGSSGARADRCYISYGPDGTTAPLTLESPAQPSPVINLYPSAQPPSVFNTTAAYQPDGGGGGYFPPSSHSHLFPTSLDVRPRLGSTMYVAPLSTLPSSGRDAMSAHNAGSSTQSTGMAHASRSTALPIPSAQITRSDIYAPATPFRRVADHATRSPPFVPTLRRHPLSPTPSPNLGFTAPLRMDAGFGPKSQQNLPPLATTTNLGTLHAADGSSVKVEINGTIDKGFFLADNEWTCYRRNYFSCVCSYSLSPYHPATPLQLHLPASGGNHPPYNVCGFAMCISAVVADNDGHTIDLVQHTPKRDKGPIVRPERVRLSPKPSQAAPHSLGALYGQADAGLGASSRYDQGYTQQGPQCPTEHTFERIQFKQATANNGKRRAAQQYYHLMIELWADVGAQAPDSFIKIAYRKSAKMIVRGRSPGHYQSERRGSASSGPGGSAGSLGGYQPAVMGDGYPGGASNLLSGYPNSYDPRSTSHFGAGPRHHHELAMDHVMSAEEVKAITEPKDYRYYPGAIYDANADAGQPVEMFASHQPHHRSDGDTAVLPALGTGTDVASKVKPDYDGGAGKSTQFYPGPSYYLDRCKRFEGKSTSSGYYPIPAPPSGLNMT